VARAAQTEGARVRRELAADLRRKDQARHAELRAALQAARAGKQRSLARIRDLCSSLRADLRRRARELRREASEHLTTAKGLDSERAALGVEAAAKRGSERELRAAKVKSAAAELASAREERRQARVRARPTSAYATASQQRATGARRAVERRAESDEEVLTNIPAELVPLWQTVRRGIRGSARQSRTEEFLRYVEEHPDEQWAAQEAAAELDLRAHERDLRAHARAMREPARYRSSARMLTAGAELASDDTERGEGFEGFEGFA
jgi:hypothetical protein